MSALTDAIDAAPRKRCAAAKARAALDPESAADFDAWMAGKPVQKITPDGVGVEVKLSDAALWVALQNLNFRVAQQTLGRHRRQQGECGCRP